MYVDSVTVIAHDRFVLSALLSSGRVSSEASKEAVPVALASLRMDLGQMRDEFVGGNWAAVKVKVVSKNGNVLKKCIVRQRKCDCAQCGMLRMLALIIILQCLEGNSSPIDTTI